jgi:hypothetical protein
MMLTPLVDPARKKAVANLVNDLSEKVAGRDRRALFGADGIPHLPEMSGDRLQLQRQVTTALKNARVYLLPGAPWPGVAQNGAAWLEPWSRMLESLGVGRAVPVPYEGNSFLGGTLRIFTDPLFKTSERTVLSRISDDLAQHPLKPGERLFILGHSYGAKVGAKVADTLKQRGLPIEGTILLGTSTPGVGQFVERSPAVKTVLEVENDPRTHLKALPGTDLRELTLPQLRHMDLVMNPPANQIDQIVRTLAEVPVRGG